MASYFRIACVALSRAEANPTRENIDYAIDRCQREWRRGGSQASWNMLEAATRLRLASIHASRDRGLTAAQHRAMGG